MKNIRSAVLAVFFLLSATSLRAERFNIQIGDLVADGIPGPGAGSIPSATTNDLYTFTAAAGQLVFLEELSVAAAFQGYLQWSLTAPSGVSVFSAYFTGQPKGRKVLPEAGAYTVRVWVGANNPAFVGTYSFRIRSIPADHEFGLQIGDTVAPGLPSAGAGMIEVPGASDVYTFQATAGQAAYFQAVSVTNAFRGWLSWELRSPSNVQLFRTFFGTDVGRVNFSETGVYRLRFIVDANDPAYVGSYAFRLRGIAPEPLYAVQIGDQIADGQPAPGAGNIETPGAEDRYQFNAVAGQEVFFDGTSASSAFGGWLTWELKAPSGRSIFRTYFGETGRKQLPEAGVYTLRLWVSVNDPARLGTYSFRLTPVGESRFPLRIGSVVSDGVPGPGAGRIEGPGGQDYYTFEGLAGQTVNFEQTSAAASFEGYLAWEIKLPNGATWVTDYFDHNRWQRRILPTNGTYTIRVLALSSEPGHVGAYSFRTWCDVTAGADRLQATAGATLVAPIASLLCNDRGELGDALELDLVVTNSTQGGVVTRSNGNLLYTPRAGFTGLDTFTYRLRGSYGGVDNGSVSVQVVAGTKTNATIVSLHRPAWNSVAMCLLGAPGQTYQVDESTNLLQWVWKDTLVAGPDGAMSYGYFTTNGLARYYRFRGAGQ